MSNLDNSVSDLCTNFNAAVLALASGSGTIKKRLLSAYTSKLVYNCPSSEVPNELTSRISALRSRMWVDAPEGQGGTAAQAIDAMTDEEAVEVVEEIFDLHLELQKQQSPRSE